MHSTPTSPTKERINTAVGIAGSVCILLCILGISFLDSEETDTGLPSTIKTEREATLIDHGKAEQKKLQVTEWVDAEDKIARVPIETAIDLVLEKFESEGNILFSGGDAPAVGTKLSTGPFTLAKIPPLAQDPERDAEIIALSKDPTILEAGFKQYQPFCMQCHGGPEMPGDGPSVLFDNKWYYSPSPSQMEQLIWKGILEKGMPPWEGILSPEATGAIVAYIIANQAD